MDHFTKEDLNTLAQVQGEWCVSLYQPTHKIGQDVLQDPTRLKNLIRNAQDQLETLGLRRPDVEALLEPASSLVLNGDFWQHQDNGLAVFVAPGVFADYQTPIIFDDLAFVSNRFHLKPILPLLTNDGEFYLLALSQSNVRLFHGTRKSIEQAPLRGVPTSLHEALKDTVTGQQIQYHTRAGGSASPGGQRTPMFHGHGEGKDQADNDLLNYFHLIDKGVTDLVRDSKAPLVIAGVDYLHPIYRQANHYNNLLDQGMVGNPDDLRGEELHPRAWKIVEPIYKAAEQEVAERYRALMGQRSNRASDRLEDIAPAAYEGRVDVLFVDKDAQQWGVYDAENARVTLHKQAQPGDYCLLDAVAVQTVLNGGTVYAEPHHNLPGHHQVAAVFRY